jgi:hypothetical protein
MSLGLNRVKFAFYKISVGFACGTELDFEWPLGEHIFESSLKVVKAPLFEVKPQ